MNVTTIRNASNDPGPRAKVLVGLTAQRRTVPLRVLVYGQAGVGKSTFAAGAPKPIFLGSEDGTAELEVVRYPKALQSGDDLFEAIDVLEHEDHGYETAVLDTVDWAEPLIWESVCAAAGKAGKGIESLGYGKGYTAAQEMWLRVLKRFDVLREKKKMHVILLGHSTIRTFKNPEGEDYDHYTLKMHEKSAGVLREWCDDVLFARQEKFTHKKDDAAKAKIVTNGARVLRTRDEAAFFAKNRHSLPPSLPLNWADFWAAVKAARPEDPEVIRTRIEEMLTEYLTLDTIKGADFVKTVREHVTAVGENSVRLSEFANRVSARLLEKREAV